MAKLTRYLQKIFANNSNQVGVFGTGVDKETSKNVETLQSADYENGWSSAIITNKNYPIWQEMDGVQYGLSYQLKYLFQNGIPEWISTETYYTNSYCRVGSNIYYSLQDDNINHNPALNDGWWTPLLTSNRFIGEIVTSTLPLTDAGLHLLDGSLIQGNGVYSDFVSYVGDLYNTTAKTYKPSAFTVVGTPTITSDGVASGFSTSNYISDNIGIDCSNNVEITFKYIQLNGTQERWQCMWSIFNSSWTDDHFMLVVEGTTTVRLIYPDGADHSYSEAKYDNFLPSGTGEECLIKVVKTPASLKLYKDNVLVDTISINNSYFNFTSSKLLIGSCEGDSHYKYLANATDLKQFSISVDGTQVLSGSDRTGFCLESEWQSSVTNYGVCGKFVYEPSSNTVRLPKITGFTEGTIDVTTLGDLVQAGLPNITGNFANGDTNYATGAFEYGGEVAGSTQAGGSTDKYMTFDASRSSLIYGNSTTVQPQAIKVLYYIVVATSIKTEIEVDIDNILSDLNGKADTDLSNVPASKGILEESYVNGASWYRVYSDGWCEQGGGLIATDTITFLKPFINTNITLLLTRNSAFTGNITAGYHGSWTSVPTTTGFTCYYDANTAYSWRACGYIR